MMFHLSLPRDQLTAYLRALLQHHIPDGCAIPSPERWLDRALDRAEHCFGSIHRKYFREGDTLRFDHLNGDQMAAFLYLLANTAWKEDGEEALATRLFYLNKILHGLDLYFSVQMPEAFRLVHPVGTVLGRADYGNYLMVYQNCSVGADEAGIYPRFGEGTILFSRSSVLGDCTLGDNVVIGANTFVLNTDVPANSVVVGQYPDLRMLPNERSVRERAFDPVQLHGVGASA